MKYQYRKAVLSDIDEVMFAVEDARDLLKLQGNGQWQFGYPNRNDFLNDIKNGNLYVVLDLETNSKIVSLCAITGYEEEYNNIYDGKWLTDYDYLVLHRAACRKEYRGKGYGKALFNMFEEVAISRGIKSIRFDTHANNPIMNGLAKKCNYIYCGKVILYPNKHRILYEKVVG